MSLWSTSSRPLKLPGSPDRRLIRRPDFRHIVKPRLSAAALDSNEVDYDELDVLRSWRVFEPDTPNEVRYFMLEVAQTNPGEVAPWIGYKAVRFLRLTRVPRWLRQQGSGVGRIGTSQMSYVLAAMREQGILFIQMVTKAEDSSLIFAYGVQALGATPEEAQKKADEAFSSLKALLDGTFQQIEYNAITVAEGERIALQQATWQEVAMARGRPMLNTGHMGASALLDGNRTDMENTHNQLEAFLRGLSETRKGFMLTLVTVPLSVADMNVAVANVARHLSIVRSETRGNRAFSAGAAIPLSVGASEGMGASDSITQTASNTAMSTDGISVSETAGSSQSFGQGSSESTAAGSTTGITNTDSSSFSDGRSSTFTDGTSSTTGSSSGLSSGTSESGAEGTSSSTGASSTDSSGTSSNTSGSFSEAFSESTADSANLGIGGAIGSGTTNASGQTNTAGSTTGTGATNSSTSGTTSTTGTSATNTAGSSQSSTNSTTQSSGSSQSSSSGRSQTSSTGVSQANSASNTDTSTSGRSNSSAMGSSAAATTGSSSSSAQSQGLSDAYAVAMSRQAGQTGSLGVIPSFGVSVSKETLDAGKKLMGDVLEETMRRYVDGVEGGAYLYQMFLQAEDRETLMAGAALLKASFWGPGDAEHRLGQPFHVVTDPASSGIVKPEEADAERDRILSHAQSFSSYRRREPAMELIEPFVYSSYVTTAELSAFARPPVAESIGLLAVHDSSPVMAMPGDRTDRDIPLGYVFNGERGRVSNTKFGIDADEITHTLVTGVTGSGKTTTLMRMLAELCSVERTITVPPTPDNPMPQTKTVPASILALDWMRNMRHLGSLIDPVRIDPITGERTGRFQFFSVRDRDLGAFTWNPLAVPCDEMSPVEWLNATADNMVASWNLGEFGRSLIADYLDRLYTANRLEPFTLRPAKYDEQNNLVREALVLDPIDPASIPEDALAVDESGNPVANVYSYPTLSRLVGVQHLAVLVAAELEAAATIEGGRQGTSVRDRLQSLWRRVSYFAPGGQLDDIIGCDTSLNERNFLTIDQLIDPDAGLVSVIETDGLDLANRRFILGSVMMAMYRTGLHRGEGSFNQDDKGPGLFVVLEEAHELFGEQGSDDDAFSASTRTALYESMHRRARALGAKLIDVVQNPGDVPEAITSNTSTVFVHRTYADEDRKRVFSLLNWSNQIGQQLREYRFLGEMPRGHVIARLDARNHFLESAPVHFKAEPAALGKVTDSHLRDWARLRLKEIEDS